MAMISLVFLFSLVHYGCSLPTSKLAIQPLKPLVERGGTIQLICSMDCPEAEVQWEGLDTDLGNIVSNHSQSILTLSNATVNTEGTKMCSGRCGQGMPSWDTVELSVYSFPDTLQLDSQPKRLTVGQPARLLCSVSHVYPHGALMLSWFQGEEQFEASKTTEEEEMEEEQLFVYRSELELPKLAGDAPYKCKATLEVQGKIFARERVALALTSPKSTQELLSATESIALTPTSGRTSRTSAPELLTTADWKSSIGTTTSLLGLVSTERTSSGTSVVTPTAVPTLKSLTEDHNSITVVNDSITVVYNSITVVNNSITVVNDSIIVVNDSITVVNDSITVVNDSITVVNNTTGSSYPTVQELTTTPLSTAEGTTEIPITKPVSTTNGFSIEGTTKKPKDACRPMIVPVPAQGIMGGILRITCQTAKCSREVEIQWVETPMARSRYRLEEGEGRSTLMVESFSLEHQGVYQCVVIDSPPRIASLRVVVSSDTVNTDALFTVGATGSLLGLIVTGYITHRWRQRRRW